MLRDLNIFSTTKANHRAVIEQLKQLAINNNTTGASIYDLGQLMIADNLPDVTEILKESERKQNQIRQEQAQQQEAMLQQELQAKAEEERMKREFEATENDKNRASRLQEAQIKSAGFGATVDINQNQQSDYMDALKEINRTNAQLDNINLQREKEINRQAETRQQTAVKQEELNVKRELAQTQLQIARENKNKYDKKDKGTKKK
jgi:hypothetical protein